MAILPPELESNYEVLQPLGEGGMGAVYKVRHRHLDEVRVIKVMHAKLQSNPQMRERFLGEAKKGKKVRHRNIAEVLDFVVGSNGNAHLVMEYIDGVDLRAYVHRNGGRLEPATVVAFGVQTLAALAALHDKKLVHRDISPDNLMLTSDAEGAPLVKLIDLGIAKSLEEDSQLTRAGAFIGKLSYASPEQMHGMVDARSDLYSTGIVLYELLAGTRPIIAGDFSITHPPAPSALRQGLFEVILKALQLDPDRRYQTAAEFAAALRGAVPQAEISTAPDRLLPGSKPETIAPTVAVTPGAPAAPRSARTVFRLSAIAAIVLACSTVTAMWMRTNGLDDTLRSGLAMRVRMAVDAGRNPTLADPAIAPYMLQMRISKSEAQVFVDDLTKHIREAGTSIDNGKKMVGMGEYYLAYTAFRQATKVDPGNAKAWANLGGAAALIKQDDEAQKDYEHALALDAGDWLAHYNYACLLARRGKGEAAFEQLASAVRQVRSGKPAAEVELILRQIRSDAALGELRNEPRFQRLVAAAN